MATFVHPEVVNGKVVKNRNISNLKFFVTRIFNGNHFKLRFNYKLNKYFGTIFKFLYWNIVYNCWFNY